MKKIDEAEYLYQAINNTDPPEISQSVINRVLHIFDVVEKIYDTGRIKPKGCKSFLNYNLVISDIFNLLGRRDLVSMI